MKLFNKILVLNSLLFLFVGCVKMENFESMINDLEKAEVLKLPHGIKPSKKTIKNLEHLKYLDNEEIKLFSKYLENAKEKRMSYVFSNYYLRLSSKKYNNKILGIVIDGHGVLIGIDVTLDNAITVPVTGIHSLFINEDKKISKELLKNMVGEVDYNGKSLGTCQ